MRIDWVWYVQRACVWRSVASQRADIDLTRISETHLDQCRKILDWRGRDCVNHSRERNSHIAMAIKAPRGMDRDRAVLVRAASACKHELEHMLRTVKMFAIDGL